jgi:hypothetical protein
VNLNNLDEIEKIVINPPIITDKVKITIIGVYGQGNNGGAINVYGTKCISSVNGMKIGSDGKPYVDPEEPAPAKI